MDHTTNWRKLLSAVNVREIGEREALRQFCDIGRYFGPQHEWKSPRDRYDFLTLLRGHLDEILGTTEYEFESEDYAEIEAHLDNGKSVEEIALHCFGVKLQAPAMR